MAVDHDIQQTLEQVADPVGGQVAALVPAAYQRADVEAVILAHGDERGGGDESVHLGRGQLPRLGVESDGIRAEEQMTFVAVQLGTLMLLDGVFDGQIKGWRPNSSVTTAKSASSGSRRSNQTMVPASPRWSLTSLTGKPSSTITPSR